MLGRIALLLVTVALLAGCVVTPEGVTVGSSREVIMGSGNTVTRDYDFSGFSRLAVGNAFRVDVERGDAYRVSVTVDDNIEQYLDVRQDGDQVRIYLKPRLLFGFGKVTLEAKVTMPEVTALDFSGASRATVTGFESTKSLDVDVSGASRLDGDIQAGQTGFDVSGASTVDLRGTASGLRAEASGASTLRLGEFATTDAEVRASGASRIVVNATGRITGDASGASTIEYSGNPASVRVDTSGASSVKSR